MEIQPARSQGDADRVLRSRPSIAVGSQRGARRPGPDHDPLPRERSRARPQGTRFELDRCRPRSTHGRLERGSRSTAVASHPLRDRPGVASERPPPLRDQHQVADGDLPPLRRRSPPGPMNVAPRRRRSPPGPMNVAPLRRRSPPEQTDIVFLRCRHCPSYWTVRPFSNRDRADRLRSRSDARASRTSASDLETGRDQAGIRRRATWITQEHPVRVRSGKGNDDRHFSASRQTRTASSDAASRPVMQGGSWRVSPCHGTSSDSVS